MSFLLRTRSDPVRNVQRLSPPIFHIFPSASYLVTNKQSKWSRLLFSALLVSDHRATARDFSWHINIYIYYLLSIIRHLFVGAMAYVADL